MEYRTEERTDFNHGNLYQRFFERFSGALKKWELPYNVSDSQQGEHSEISLKVIPANLPGEKPVWRVSLAGERNSLLGITNVNPLGMSLENAPKSEVDRWVMDGEKMYRRVEERCAEYIKRGTIPLIDDLFVNP